MRISPIALLSLACVVALAACSKDGQGGPGGPGGQMPPPEVGVVTLQKANVPLVKELVGRLAAPLREALALVPDEPTPMRARVLSLHARAHLFHGLDDMAAQQAMEALGLHTWEPGPDLAAYTPAEFAPPISSVTG